MILQFQQIAKFCTKACQLLLAFTNAVGKHRRRLDCLFNRF
jgi:hypothetical protein